MTAIKPNKIKNDNQGFTLIEVMIAIVVGAVGILAVASMQTTAINQNAFAIKQTVSSTLVTDRIEQLMALEYDAADMDAGSHTPVTGLDGIDNDENGTIDEGATDTDADGLLDTAGGETGHISISWTVTENEPIPNTKTVNITVTRTKSNPLTLTYIKAITI